VELLEREQYLSVLRDCPPGSIVLVSGEAGIGKTALVRAFCADEVRTALWGACDALRTPRPLGPLQDIARQAGSDLARAMAAEGPRHAIFGAFLDELAARPTVAVVEDAHWADEATLDLLVFLGRRISQTCSLLIVTYREDLDSDHPLRGVLGALAGLREVHRISLPPLSPAAVERLAAPRGLDPTELHARTGGNPFFVSEVLADPDPAVPASVRDAVLAHAMGLGERGREALYAVAISPGPASLALVQAPPDAIDACVAAGILIHDGRSVRFRHELARLAIEGSIPPGRWTALHAQALAGLRERGAEPAHLAYHAEEAGDGAAVLTHAVAAASRAVALGAHRQAADHYAQALRYGDGLDAQRRAELLEAYAQICFRLDRSQEAVELSARAVHCWRAAGDKERQAAALALHGYYHWHRIGGRPAARAGVQAALDLVGQLPPGPGLAAAYTWSAVLLMSAGDVAGTMETGGRAIALAESLGDQALLSRALNAVGTIQWLSDPEAAERMLLRSLRLARQVDDDSLILAAMVNLGAGATEARLYDTAERWLGEAIAWCSRRDLDGYRGYANACLARCLLERGRWPEAAEILDNAEPGHVYTAIVRLTELGRLRARRGEPGASEALMEAWNLTAPLEELLCHWRVAAARAELAWLHGETPDEGVRDVYELAVQKGHYWAVGELGQWVNPDGNASHEAAAAPYRLDPAAAARAWDHLGCPYEAAMALARSPEHWAEALARFERLGARPAAERLTRLMRERGRRPPHRSTLVHPYGLTARQADVLNLLREGLRNADIAARLRISEKTVDHHVSAILAKLGVGSRREAARYAPA
jgi:DNA-binding CsgD family transcriptional regulator/tetratricopeptide (TPR) repeat protein